MKYRNQKRTIEDALLVNLFGRIISVHAKAFKHEGFKQAQELLTEDYNYLCGYDHKLRGKVSSGANIASKYLSDHRFDSRKCLIVLSLLSEELEKLGLISLPENTRTLLKEIDDTITKHYEKNERGDKDAIKHIDKIEESAIKQANKFIIFLQSHGFYLNRAKKVA